MDRLSLPVAPPAPIHTLALPQQDGRTPLHYADHYGHLPVVQALLLDPLVNPGTKDNVSTLKRERGRKGLHHSLAHPSLAAPLQTLALPLQDGRTPLHHAAHYGHLQVVQALLLDPLVNPETKDNVSTQRG